MLDNSLSYLLDRSFGMLNRLSPARLLLLIGEIVGSVAVSGNGSLSNLLPVSRRLPRLALVVVKLVDLLKSHVLGLVDGEVHEEHRDPGETTPDPEHVILSGIKSADKVRSDVRQEPVEEPVGGGGL